MQIRIVDEQEVEHVTEKQASMAGRGFKAKVRTRNGKRIIEVFNNEGTFKRVRWNVKKGNTLKRIQAELQKASNIAGYRVPEHVADIEEYVMRRFNEVASAHDKQLMDDFIEHFDGDVSMTENEGSTTRNKGVYFRINYGGTVNAPKPTIDKKLT